MVRCFLVVLCHGPQIRSRAHTLTSRALCSDLATFRTSETRSHRTHWLQMFPQHLQQGGPQKIVSFPEKTERRGQGPGYSRRQEHALHAALFPVATGGFPIRPRNGPRCFSTQHQEAATQHSALAFDVTSLFSLMLRVMMETQKHYFKPLSKHATSPGLPSALLWTQSALSSKPFPSMALDLAEDNFHALGPF